MDYIDGYIAVCSAMLFGVAITCLFGWLMPPMPRRWLLVYAGVFFVMAIATRPFLMALVIPNPTGL